MKIRYLVLFFCLGTLWTFHLFRQPWTQDEGLYLYAAQNIWLRNLFPYVDFSYIQMPLYPFLLAPFLWIFQNPLWVGRGISLVCFFTLLTFIFLKISQTQIKKGWGILCVLWIALHPLVWGYFILVKPYAITTLLMIASLYIVLSIREKGWIEFGFPLFSGFLLGLATAIRLNSGFAIILLLPLLWENKKNVGTFILGFVLANLGTLFLCILNPQAFYFNVFQYHNLRSSIIPDRQMIQRFKTLWVVFKDPFFFLTTLGLIALISFRKISKSSLYLLFLAGLTFLPFLRISPFYDEYVSVPFVIFSLVLFLEAGRFLHFRWIPWALSLLVVVSFLDRERGNWTPSIPPPMNSVEQVKKVGEKVAELTKPDEEFFSFWNGYAVASKRKLPSGGEAGIAILEMDGKLSLKELADYKISSIPEISTWISQRRYHLVVTGLATPEGFDAYIKKYYGPGEPIGGATIYTRSD